MAEPSTTPVTNPLLPPVTKSWSDKADEETEASATATETSSVNLDALKIEDNNENPPKLLDDPDVSIIQSAAKFEDLNLTPELLNGLYVEMKFQKPSKIQAISLPMILSPPHRDLIVQAHNGPAKTMCFVLGMLSRVDAKVQAPQAFCVCPTRELANQNIEVLRKMGKYTGIASECAVPGVNAFPIAKRAPIMAQVVIGTPGTIKKWMSFKKLGVSRLKILVFDETDQMLAEDGKDNSLRIMKEIQKVNSNCQVLLFSATFNDTVNNFVSRTVKADHNKLFVKNSSC